MKKIRQGQTHEPTGSSQLELVILGGMAHDGTWGGTAEPSEAGHLGSPRDQWVADHPDPGDFHLSERRRVRLLPVGELTETIQRGVVLMRTPEAIQGLIDTVLQW